MDHATVGGHALLAGEEIRDRTAPCLSSPTLAGLLPRRRGDTPSAEILRPSGPAPSVTAIRKYGSADAHWTTTSYEQAMAARAKLAVDVGMGYFRAHGCRRAYSSGRRGDSRSYGGMPPRACPRRPAAALWVEGNQDEARSARMLRLSCSVPPVTAIRKHGAANARRTTSFEQAFAARVKLVVDVCLGYI